MTIRAIDLLSVRRSLRPFLVERIEVWRPVQSSDSAGGTVRSYARVATLPGRVGLAAGGDSETITALRLADVDRHVVTLEVSADIRVDDQLRTDGRTFEVTGTNQPHSYPLTQRVSVRELQ